MSNDFEIRERMGSYRGVLLVLVWILAIIGVITGIKLITVVNDYAYQYYDFYGIVLIVTSIVGGIVGHLLVTVVFEIVFMLTEIKEQQRLNVINSNASPAVGSSANHEEKFTAMDVNTAAPPIPFSTAKLTEDLTSLAYNSEENLYTVTIEPCNISDNWGVINSAVQNAGKYVILDLSACTATDNTIRGNKAPTGNDFNIIWDNKYIKGILLYERLTSIDDYAFYGCGNFTSITIPSGVNSIGEAAFEYCTRLTSVTFSRSNISGDNFGNRAFPEGSFGDGGNTLKNAYATGIAGTYTRAVGGSIWTKQE